MARFGYSLERTSQLMPLLNTLLSEESKVRDKILFGTDFYVVNTKSTEKSLLNDINFHLSEEYFQLVAKTNPEKYLNIN